MGSADQAPEVFRPTHYYAAPEFAAYAPSSCIGKSHEGLQVIDCLPPEVDERKIILAEENEDENAVRTHSTSRRKLLWGCGVTTMLILVAIGLGVGLGLGLKSASNNGNHHKNASSTRTPSTISASMGTANTKPTQTRPVTSGSSGIASYSCNNTAPYNLYTTPDGTKFREECNVVYAKGDLSHNSTVTIEDLSILTVYSFKSCMIHCTDWNANPSNSGSQCGAVSYNANLTFSEGEWHANCFIKNARGTPSASNPDENYGLVGSAYII